jgi:hypothetical protein
MDTAPARSGYDVVPPPAARLANPKHCPRPEQHEAHAYSNGWCDGSAVYASNDQKHASKAACVAPEASVYASKAASHTPRSRSTSDAGGAKRRLMIALAQNPKGTSPRKLSILADVKQGGSTWRAAFAAFRREGHIFESVSDAGDVIQLTREGLQVLGKYEPLPTGAKLREHWRGNMGGGAKLRIFNEVLGAYPKAIAATKVAEAAAVELGGSTWRAAMAYFRGLELVDDVKDGDVLQLRAADVLFK